MIAFVEGELVDKQPDNITVSVGGIGLQMYVPLSTLEALGPARAQVRVETVLHAREDGMQLYGFATAEEKRLFEVLITLPGIGPGVALNILSGATVAEFTAAIINEDIGKLVSLPKIGRKTAQRLIMELRDKLAAMDTDGTQALPVAPAGEAPEVDDAITGLVSLGLDHPEARRQVIRVLSESPETPDAEEIIRTVLKSQKRQ
ncbi:MAG: Holliday junction branch migration protein RuvA [Gemmatimonadetes bacterium]|nr:Holliday junction branch migration protein RuvA [Gemmatimonadota bacterium]MYH20068.1 Holliday junction branch migration protein RuvA [Gemmatimonadota bacterium]MYK97317.1 Holliday junction branch migration protein RuvA [Gemmatimonadota bacterium]